jgi:hypothetical protein
LIIRKKTAFRGPVLRARTFAPVFGVTSKAEVWAGTFEVEEKSRRAAATKYGYGCQGLQVERGHIA